jgi:hypothetical protein
VPDPAYRLLRTAAGHSYLLRTGPQETRALFVTAQGEAPYGWQRYRPGADEGRMLLDDQEWVLGSPVLEERELPDAAPLLRTSLAPVPESSEERFAQITTASGVDYLVDRSRRLLWKRTPVGEWRVVDGEVREPVELAAPLTLTTPAGDVEGARVTRVRLRSVTAQRPPT